MMNHHVLSQIPLILVDVAVLDMNAASLEWVVPQTMGTAPPGRYLHSAVMVGTVCMIFFGESC